jgi:mannose-6-phosphate isomerase-like protein (cupin superfamily)
MSLNRRQMCLALPALFLFVSCLSAVGEESALPSGAFRFDQLPLYIANNNAQIRMIMRGKLASREGIEVHETTLPPGGAPTTTTHHHPHSETWLVREGAIELTVNGKTHPFGPGSLGFARSNHEHGIRNIGNTAATGFLIAVGPGAQLQT